MAKLIASRAGRARRVDIGTPSSEAKPPRGSGTYSFARPGYRDGPGRLNFKTATNRDGITVKLGEVGVKRKSYTLKGLGLGCASDRALGSGPAFANAKIALAMAGKGNRSLEDNRARFFEQIAQQQPVASGWIGAVAADREVRRGR